MAGHAGLLLFLALASSLPSTVTAFQAPLYALKRYDSTGKGIFSSRAGTLQRPVSWRRAGLTMQEQYSTKYKKIYPGRPDDPDEESFLLSTISLSDSYKEDSRMYRRTVFDPEDWKKFRSSYRIVRNLSSMFTSGVLRGLWVEIGAVSLVALLVIVWNTVLVPEIGGSIPKDAASYIGPLHLPTLPFTISSPALGLLLVFRTNTCYARWKEAGQGLTYIADEDKEEFVRRVMAVPRTFKFYLRGGEQELEERDNALQALLGEVEAARLAGEEQPTTHAIMDVTAIVKRNAFESSTRAGFDKHLDGLTSNILFCDRLLKTPVPLVYTRHTSRFLALWMLLLPLALYDQLSESWLLLPITAVVAVFFFGIEELDIEEDLREMLTYDRKHATPEQANVIGKDAEAWL